MLLRDYITRGVAAHPRNVALIFRDQPTTYGELAVGVQRLAAGLVELGLKKGDRIALLLPNSTPFVVAYYAAAQIGIVAVPANPLLKPAELAFIWQDAGVRLVITAIPLLPNVQSARANLPELEHVISISPRDDLPEPAAADLIPGFSTLPELMARGATALAVADNPKTCMPDIDENECAVLIYTSGTTGHPKGAMLSNRNLTRNVEQVEAALHFTAEDRFITVLPLFHSFAGTVCLNLVLAIGGTSVLMENFVPARVLEAVEKHRVTIFPAVPAIYNAVLNVSHERDYDFSSLRAFVSGGAPLPATTLSALELRFGVPVLEGDGPTECSPVTSVNRLEGPRKLSSIGPPLSGVEMAIFDEADNPLPPEEIGEIVVRGDNVMVGYWKQPEATAEAMRNGWYHTGDLGKRDEDGFFYIVDRKKDMIITMGLNVYPREVEEVLYAHPAVGEAAVIGMPDALKGEEVVAVVMLKPGQKATERELIAHCRKRLANFKVPRNVLFRETLPRSGSGKTLKRLLKKELELESTGM